MLLFDSHAHYFDKKLDQLGGADAVLSDLVFGGCIGRVLNVGTNNENNILCIEEAGRYKEMYAAVGIHPEDADFMKLSLMEEMAKLRTLLEDVGKRKEKKIVALGEIGLDYHYDGVNKEHQMDFFKAQMELAEELGMPVIIHDRDAHGDCFETVLKYPNVKGVFHSYSGSAEMALELIKRGWYISFSGVVTFKNAERVRQVVSRLPLERLLIETDAPYLAPHPHRGEVNHSGLMKYTAEAIAAVKGIAADDLARITYSNASELFGI